MKGSTLSKAAVHMALNPELIGATLTFKMCAGEPVTGILYAYDDASNSIAITEHVVGTTCSLNTANHLCVVF